MDSMFVSSLLYNFFVTEDLDLKNLSFVHLNHGVREESKNEEVFIKEFFGNNIDIIQNKASYKTEESMRNWRYEQFDKLCNEKNIDFLVTGHHLNDRVESSLLHMLRGSGLRGFLSMQFCESHSLLDSAMVLRPLLSMNK
ncbi:MAG: hypothetical protein GXP45_03905 [bacterium]|nr:hypothetical protein [bacterium]